MPTLSDRRASAPALAVGVGVALVLGTGVAGTVLLRRGVDLHLLGGVILRAGWDPRPGPSTVLPVVVGVLGVVVAAPMAARLAWRGLLVTSVLAAAGWAVALGLVDGVSGLTQPLASRYEYLHDVDRVGSWGRFVSTFTESIPADSADPWTTHVAGHPPGALLAFAGLDRIGLGGTGWAAALCIAAGSSAVAAVLIATRAVAGEAVARAAAPFVVLAPIAVWIATSADALFLGVSAWGLAALAVAARSGPPVALALLGGVLLGSALFLSYGLVLLAPLAAAIVLVRRRWSVLLLGLVGVLVVVAAYRLAGFWWVDGVRITSERVRGGPGAMDRPSGYFVVANLAAAALSLGPAGVGGIGAALTRGVRRTAAAVLPFGALAGILIADLSLLSKGEVERIYLPFFPWILTAAALLPAAHRRRWLAAQVATAILIQVLVRTEW